MVGKSKNLVSPEHCRIVTCNDCGRSQTLGLPSKRNPTLDAGDNQSKPDNVAGFDDCFQVHIAGYVLVVENNIVPLLFGSSADKEKPQMRPQPIVGCVALHLV